LEKQVHFNQVQTPALQTYKNTVCTGIDIIKSKKKKGKHDFAYETTHSKFNFFSFFLETFRKQSWILSIVVATTGKCKFSLLFIFLLNTALEL
jgi:hypothetical protein